MIIRGTNLSETLHKQLSLFWSDSNWKSIEMCIPLALERMNVILSAFSNSKYINRDNSEVVFNPLNSVQYTIFLYLLSNSLNKAQLGGGGRSLLLK